MDVNKIIFRVYYEGHLLRARPLPIIVIVKNLMEEEKKNIHSAASAHRAQDVVDKSQFTKYHTGKDGRTGHGFAAEDVNDLADRLRLKNTEKVGTNNAKNGADRMVDGVLYQTKYCKPPNATANAAFDMTTGLYL